MVIELSSGCQEVGKPHPEPREGSTPSFEASSSRSLGRIALSG
jgi:hypothetical protein